MTKMKLLKQICRHDQGVALRDMGIVQDQSTYFLNKTGEHYTITHTFIQPFETSEGNPWVAVYTVAELGELLPEGSVSFKSNGKWIARYQDKAICCFIALCDSEAQARADLLLLLLQLKVVSPESVNHKLVLKLTNELLSTDMP
jgi:hypothetical protein